VAGQNLAGLGGHHPAGATGEQGLNGVRHAPDIGVPFQLGGIDSRMPVLSGETLGRLIRCDARTKGTALVLATSAPQRGDAGNYRRAGFNAYLAKPFRAETLRATIERVLALGAAVDGTAPLITRHSLIEQAPRCVELPAALSKEPEARPAETAGPADTSYTGERARRRLRVLLAEDNPVNQMVAVSMLERLGCRVDVVGDGARALQLSSQLSYDVVFMDMQMPVMDGLEATRRIRAKDEAGAKLHIVAMTANAMQGDRERCLDAGMNDYVSKPISPESLGDALERVLTVRL